MYLLTASKARELVKPLDPSVIEDATNEIVVQVLQEIAKFAAGGNYECVQDIKGEVQMYATTLERRNYYTSDRKNAVFQNVFPKVIHKLQELGYTITPELGNTKYLISWEEATEIKGEKGEQRKA